MRAQSITLGPVADADLTKLLIGILDREKQDLGSKEDAIIKKIVEAAYGIPRQAVQILDSVATTMAGGGQPSEALQMALKNNSINDTMATAIDFIKAYANGKPEEILRVLRATGTADGVLEVLAKILPALAYNAIGEKPKDGIGWVAIKGTGKIPLAKVLDLQKRVVAALDIRVRSNYQVSSELLLTSLAD
jgi:hypothetical protein